MSEHSNGTAVVTGASSGLGAVYADRLAKRGFDLILVARNRNRLDALAQRLINETGRSVKVIAADLTDRSGLADMEEILRAGRGITLLVNNAGVGAGSSLINSDIGEMENMLAINVNALTRLTYAIVPAFLNRGGGTIINISSIVAIWPEILNGVYAGSKAYVIAFSQSLRNELADTNIRIQVVVPGATATNFWNVAGVDIDTYPSEAIMQAEDAVDAALAGLDLGEVVTIPSLPDYSDWKAYEAARQKLIPNISRRTPADRYLWPIS
ncbi:SDR family NAD(P)-dependent oxidoreductase [Nitrobacteraceae bacterium UC4449_H16]